MALLTFKRRDFPRVAAKAALGLALLAAAASAVRAQGSSLEYAVKANYLYKFAPFVEWPTQTFDAPNSPFAVCVSGQDPFGDTLDTAVRGQTVGGRPVVVRRLAVVPDRPPCQVLYLGRSRNQSPASILALTRGEPVLTVTDQDQGSSGGIVQFVLRDGRVRFALDVARARAAGMTLSSKLQTLAVSLKGGS